MDQLLLSTTLPRSTNECVFHPRLSAFYRFGLLPLSMSNTRNTKSDRQAADPPSLVSSRKGFEVCVVRFKVFAVDMSTTCLPSSFLFDYFTPGKHCLLHSALPVFLNGRRPRQVHHQCAVFLVVCMPFAVLLPSMGCIYHAV